MGPPASDAPRQGGTPAGRAGAALPRPLDGHRDAGGVFRPLSPSPVRGARRSGAPSGLVRFVRFPGAGGRPKTDLPLPGPVPCVVARQRKVSSPLRDQTKRATGLEFSISAVRDGHGLAEFRRLSRAVSVPELLKVGEVAALWNVNVARFLPTAMLCSPQGPGGLEPAERPEIGAIEAETPLGRLSLDAYLEHPEARMQGICVVHRGQVVFERYPGMRPEQPHLWASCAKPLAGLA